MAGPAIFVALPMCVCGIITFILGIMIATRLSWASDLSAFDFSAVE